MDSRKSDKFTFGRGDQTVKPAETAIPHPEPRPAGDTKIPAALYIFLGLLMIAIIMVYFDLFRRVTYSKSAGSEKLTYLAQDLDHRFSSLSIKQARLEEQLKKKISDDAQVIKELKAELEQARKDLKSTTQQLTTKADKSDLTPFVTAATLTAVKTRIEKLGAETKTALEKIKTVETRLTETLARRERAQEELTGEIGEINRLLDQSSKTIIDIESRIAAINTAKIDKKTVEKLIKNKIGAQQSTSAALSKQISADRDRIDTNRRQIRELKKNSSLYEGQILKIKRQLNALKYKPSAGPSKSRPAPSAAPSPKPIKSGEIIQQNLNE